MSSFMSLNSSFGASGNRLSAKILVILQNYGSGNIKRNTLFLDS